MKTPIFVVVAFSIAILSGNLAVDGSGPITWKDCCKSNSIEMPNCMYLIIANNAIMKINNITFDPPGDVYPGQGFSLKATFELSNDKST